MNKNDITPLKDLLDSMRDIEGFPIGKDEDILALSNPPYYTACPNPYINDFIKEHGKLYNEETDDYHCEPFVGDVSEGKNDPIYNAHSYHTKVPHKAIMKYIEHYTEKNDIVFDGFCGTGMTGVAAQMLNRKAILSDLSPIATFIAYNYNSKVDVDEFKNEARRILKKVEEECGWMYETNHVTENEEKIKSEDGEQLSTFGDEQKFKKGKINYTVWSDVFICPYCKEEFVFWDIAVDKENGKVLKDFKCSGCNAEIKKTDCKRATNTFFDKAINQDVTQAKQVPVMINYSYKYGDKVKRAEKTPDKDDLQLIEKINEMKIPYWFPTNKMPEGYNTNQPKISHGLSHVHHFYTKRNLWVYSSLLYFSSKLSKLLAYKLIWYITATSINIDKRYAFRENRKGGIVKGTLYIPSFSQENSFFHSLSTKLSRIVSALINLIKLSENNIISTQSLITYKNLSDNCVDYIFTDPPFGENLMYSEISFLWESWLKIQTNNGSEAIINKYQNKDLTSYSNLMLSSFKEYYRILKPNRWITVEFHNSKSSVWNAIQEAMAKAGFLIAQVTVLDKMQGSFKQITSAGAVKNDLVISAYKPDSKFEVLFFNSAGENLEIEFVKQFLVNLPKQPAIERTEKMLYSKMLAYYIQRGYEIRYDANTFYKMLEGNFIEVDGYWFLHEQIEAYHEYKKKMKLEGLSKVQQGVMMLFITDEKSALLWLYNFLLEPKSFSNIHTAFTKLSEISGDLMPDLKELLDNNFIFDDGKYRRPQSDSERLTINEKRERELMREFESLLLEAKGSKKKIKDVRKEAILHGFEICYKTNRYKDILLLSKRLDRRILENNADINEFVEVAEIKVEGF